MIYKVRANLIESKASEFLRKLQDGTIQSQPPDGAEIVDSMKKATVDADGVVNWTETCYCPTPLAHERATWLDKYFDDMETEPVDAIRPSKENPSWSICRK